MKPPTFIIIKLIKNMKKVIVMAVLALFVMSLYSCARNGYGCHGRGKIMTRVKGNGY